VFLKYNEDDDFFILNNINLEIQANEKLAIVGKSGSGKSTII
jgi:ABC-type bacteriocin/lantibiotic exporter with double-glycine peptidase domain